MGKKYDIVSVGESLIDFISEVRNGELMLTGHAGGAPPNVLAAASRLGRRCCHVSKVGDDAAGRFFTEALSKHGIDTSGILVDESGALTTLAIVSLDEWGDRSFVFYNKQTADTMMTSEELPLKIIEDCRILHFGTVTMWGEPMRSANLRAVERAKAAGAKISFDPNYRAFLWDDEASAISVMRNALGLADYVKLSGEEATLISGIAEPRRAAEAIFAEYSPTLLTVTLGEKGSIGVVCGGGSQDMTVAHVPSYDVRVVDTTGAGDGFWGAMLHRLLLPGDTPGSVFDEIAIGENAISADELRKMLEYANAAGALVTTKQGGIPAMPSEADIREHYSIPK